MKNVLGKTKVSTALILLEPIAEQYGLKLGRYYDFKLAKNILESRYKVIKWI